MQTMGAYEAKTHFSQLLTDVAAGQVVTITKHGHPIARLVPVDSTPADTDTLMAAIREARHGVRLNGLSVREMIDEGRR
jgi:prevent-host-death family protein